MIEEYCEICEEVVVGRHVYCEEHGYKCGLIACVQCGKCHSPFLGYSKILTAAYLGFLAKISSCVSKER